MFIEAIILENKLSDIINTISPVFIVILLGAVLRLTGFFKDEFTSSLSKLTYWVALPVMLFYSIATTDYGFGDALGIYYAVAGVMAAAIILALLLTLILRMDRTNAGAFLQGAFRGNLVYIGLPLVVYSVADAAAASKIEQTAILSLSLIVPTYNAAAVTILLVCRHNIDFYMPLKILKGLLSNPLVIAALSGIVYSHFFSEVPTSLDRSFQVVGRMALPMALLSIGATLVGTKNAADYSLSLLASAIKVGFCPVAAFWIVGWLGLDGFQKRIVLLFSACPVAVSSYIMAAQMGANARLAAAIVVVSSLLSAAAIVAVLFFV